MVSQGCGVEKSGDTADDKKSREDPESDKKAGFVIPIAAALVAAEFVAATCCTAGDGEEQHIAKKFPDSGSEDEDGEKVPSEDGSDWGTSYPGGN